MLPEGLSWLQFKRVGFTPCLRSWLTMLVCKRWEKHPHQFSLDPRKIQTFLGHCFFFQTIIQQQESFHCRFLIFIVSLFEERRCGSYSHFYCYRCRYVNVGHTATLTENLHAEPMIHAVCKMSCISHMTGLDKCSP